MLFTILVGLVLSIPTGGFGYLLYKDIISIKSVFRWIVGSITLLTTAGVILVVWIVLIDGFLNYS